MMESCNRWLLAVLAATALLGWPGRPSATPVGYLMPDATAIFRIIPNPPPHAPITMDIVARFIYDPATNTESDVVIFLWNGPNLFDQYKQLDPLVTNGREIVATGISSGNVISLVFHDHFDGRTANDLGFVIIQAPVVDTSPHNPCGPFPRACVADNNEGRHDVIGRAVPHLLGTAIPEPSSLSVFGPIGFVIGGALLMTGWANRRRVGQRSSEAA